MPVDQCADGDPGPCCSLLLYRRSRLLRFTKYVSSSSSGSLLFSLLFCDACVVSQAKRSRHRPSPSSIPFVSKLNSRATLWSYFHSVLFTLCACVPSRALVYRVRAVPQIPLVTERLHSLARRDQDSLQWTLRNLRRCVFPDRSHLLH